MGTTWEPFVQTAPNGGPNMTHHSLEVEKMSGPADIPPVTRFKIKTTT